MGNVDSRRSKAMAKAVEINELVASAHRELPSVEVALNGIEKSDADKIAAVISNLTKAISLCNDIIFEIAGHGIDGDSGPTS